MKIAIYSNHSGNNADLARLVAQNRWDYSARHGYTLVTAREDWKKSWLGSLRDILGLLDRFDAVLSVGSDVVFTNDEITLESRLRPGDNIVMARETLGPLDKSPAERFALGWSPINNDVVIWRNTPATRRFIKWIIANYRIWSRQKYLWQGFIAARMESPAFANAVRLVEPRVMNATHQPGPSRWQPGDWLIHFVGYDNRAKVALAQDYLSRRPAPRPIPEPEAALTKPMLKQVNLMIATPCYMGNVGLGFTASLMELTRALDYHKFQWSVRMPNGEMVARARNRLVADFMASDATHLLFLDSDIGFRWQDVFTMLQTNVHVIGAIYPKKSLNWDRIHAAANNGTAADGLAEAGMDYVFNPVFEKDQTARTLRGAVEVSEVGTGFLLIHRSTFTRMHKAFPQTMYFDDYPDTRGRETYALFDYGVLQRRYLSEDYLFCQRWRAIGGHVWAWPFAPLSHQGAYLFRGNFASRVKPKPTQPIKEK